MDKKDKSYLLDEKVKNIEAIAKQAVDEYKELNDNIIEIKYLLAKRQTEDTLKSVPKKGLLEKLLGWFEPSPGFPLSVCNSDGKAMRYQ